MTSDWLSVLHLYQQTVTASLLQYLQKQTGWKVRRGIYSARVVLWLMMLQRLHAGATLASAVQLLLQGAAGGLLENCHRVRRGSISSRTGGYCQARQKLPKLLCRQVSEEIVERLRQVLSRDAPGRGNVFLLDGSSLELEHCPEIVGTYPPAQNQHGHSHWPVLRIAVAHDVHTGLAQAPAWGPMYGSSAVSEQALAEEIMAQLPRGATVLGDRNFGVFWVAHAAQQRGLDVLLRLTEVRARKLAGIFSETGEREVVWKASRWDGGKHRTWDDGSQVSGRLIAARIGRGKRQEWLFLFTTLAMPAQEMVELYGRRWNIGVSRQGHIVQSVKDRPRPKDSGLVAWEASWRESKTAEPSDNILGKECAQRTRLQRTVNADVASLHESPVAETVDNARKQQGLAETSPIRQLSPAGYQRRHGVKEDVETGEALGARRRNLVEEMSAITVSGKCGHRRQGGGSGRSTGDGCAAKRARREGPGPVSTPLTKVRQGRNDKSAHQSAGAAAADLSKGEVQRGMAAVE